MHIKQRCDIYLGQVFLNEEQIFAAPNSDYDAFIAAAYRGLKINYPKFFKMDPLCKLALVGCSLILDALENKENRNIALVFGNNASCIDIDKKHLESINDPNNFFPSPANFVYTLPNIAIGEISIKYQLKTESAFFVLEENSNFLEEYAKLLLSQNLADNVLVAWIELENNNYIGKFYVVSQIE
jgi:hypothetical protein